MADAHDSWSTQQLVEFTSTVSGHAEPNEVIERAVDGAAAALDSEIAAVILEGDVHLAIGFARGQEPRELLIEAASAQAGSIEVAPIGNCLHRATDIGDGGSVRGRLLVMRGGAQGFDPDEQDLLTGMGRVLGMALTTAELLRSLHERQGLLERLSRLQRSIASRVDLDQVMGSIVDGATELIGDEMTAVRLVSADDPGVMEMVSSAGLDDSLAEMLAKSPIGVGVGGRAISEARPVIAEDYSSADLAMADVAEAGIAAAMAAPIFMRGEVAGSITVATRRQGRTYSPGEREALSAFAEHAGLALNDARAVAETVHQAFHDSLTGLPNRARFLADLEEYAAELEAEGPLAVLFVDLDGFKNVNDSLGHEAGDELLVAVSRRLRRATEGQALTLARFGGDEFAVLLRRDASGARRLADRILESLWDRFAIRERDVRVTASIGIAAGGEADHLLRNADLAMYQAKGRGKGRAELFEPGMHAAAVERLETEADLSVALEQEQLMLQYQPLVTLSEGETVAVEALVRWKHPTRGLLQPKDFIPLAEESGQILALGRWVLREACRQATVWRARRGAEDGLRVTVNVSGLQLAQPRLIGEVREALERTGLEPGCLVLEITETALMGETDANIRRLQQLSDLGVQLFVDDFGTGYSSLDYLRRFPIDGLKIAGSFVSELDQHRDGDALVRAIIELARSLGLTIIAEGIETEQQLERLIELGCPYGQGFHFSRPADPRALDEQLLDGSVTGAAAFEPMR